MRPFVCSCLCWDLVVFRRRRRRRRDSCGCCVVFVSSLWVGGVMAFLEVTTPGVGTHFAGLPEVLVIFLSLFLSSCSPV